MISTVSGAYRPFVFLIKFVIIPHISKGAGKHKSMFFIYNLELTVDFFYQFESFDGFLCIFSYKEEGHQRHMVMISELS